MPGGHRLKKESFKFAGRPPPKTRTFQICREATAQKTCTVLIVLQHEEASREATAQKTRTVLIVLQQDKGIPDNRETSEPIAVLFVLQTQEKGIPDNRVTSEPIAVLFVLQTQEKDIPDNRGMSEEKEVEKKKRRSWTIGGRRSL